MPFAGIRTEWFFLMVMPDTETETNLSITNLVSSILNYYQLCAAKYSTDKLIRCRTV